MKTSHSFSISALSLISSVAAGIVQQAANALSKRDTFQWGSIGDSYASGVAYLQSVTYDNNAGNCLRTTDAYAYQLKNDVSWMNGWTEYFTWTACSGSRLVDMQYQILGVGSSPRLVTMSAGGNDGGGNPLAGFFNVADSCLFLSNPNNDYGLPYNQDTNRTGQCAQAIDATKAYLTNGIGNDLKNTLNDVLDADNVKSQPDFLLYVTGYAQFFNPNTTWCNDHTFSVFYPYQSGPPLSQYLRNDINALVTQLNSVYEETIQAYSNVRFVNYDAAFEGQRFCEADSNIWGQYFSSDVWFWNVSPPNFSVANQTANDTQIHQALISTIGNASITPFSSGTGTVSDGWKLRPFHPTISGHAVIEQAIVAQMKTDNIPPSATAASSPSSVTSATPAASTTAPPYVPGTCSFHLDEWQDCAPDSSNLSANITMYDNAHNLIGQTDTSQSGDALGDPINISDPYSFVTKLANPMVVVGEHENDYIQFTIGTLSWKSTDSTGSASCSVGGWNPRDGPVCTGRGPLQNAVCSPSASFLCLYELCMVVKMC
ncbi:hypothetical protein MMC20_004046 [Loxospora ochrophaea]|nr:hypothetical protein [Loxospora ochrophaea]